MRGSAVLMCVVTLVIHFTSGDSPNFKITVEKVELVSFNKDLIKNPKVEVFQYNNTYQAMNIAGDLLQDLGMDLKDQADVYEIVKDDTRLITSAKDIKVCEILESGFPEIEDMFKLGNFTKCPMKKGHYSVVNALLDYRKIPGNIPRGKFLIDFFSYSGTVLITHSKTYVKIEDA